MRTSRYNLLIIALIGAASVCAAQPATNTATTNIAAPAPQKDPAVVAAENAAFEKDFAAVKGTQMPSVSNEKMQELFQDLSAIDYIFYGADFSVSTDEKNSKSNLYYISTRAAKMLEGVKPVGRVFYAAKGNIALEAEVYFGDTQVQQYLVFLKDNKAFAANYLTPQGVSFFKQVVNARVEADPKE